MSKKILAALLAATALAGVSGTPASAQVQMPGWFGAVDGQYIFRDETGGTREFGMFPYRSFNPGDGLGVSGLLGYRFMGAWDIAVGGRYVDLSKGREEANNSNTSGGLITDAKLFTIDGDIGYTFSGPGYGVRPFVGVRYQHWRTKYHDNDPPIFATTEKSWGVGPRAGVDASFVVSGPLSFFAGIDAAVLFGRIKDSKNAAWLGEGDLNGSDHRTFFDVGLKAGIDWEVSPLVHLVAGYKAEWFDGINYKNFSPGTATGAPSKRAAELLHGPFVRVAYNLGVPGSVPMPMAAAPIVQSTNAFIIFFDWDRAVLTAQAKDTVKTAAAQFKAKGNARVTLTGHADRSGSDQYNMALSLRRGAATKDELVRNGVPAASIVIIGKGESAPLVPTADGVREPQNRRVEIVLQ